MTTAAPLHRFGTPSQVVSRLYAASGIWGWSLASMGISSITNFTLSLLAGRLLGADGLGVVFAGFTSYVMLLTFHRALVTKPLIASSSSLDDAARLAATRTALTVTLSMAAASAVVVMVVGLAVGGKIGTGLLLFAPWFVPALTQDLFRSSLFRDGRPRRAAIADLAWFCTLVLFAAAAIQIETDWAVVASWGLGSVVAAGLAAVWSRAIPTPFRASWEWFRQSALPFGRWLAMQEGLFVLGFFGLYMALAGILGVDDLGGLRAAETVFAPFTLLAPALTLAGLPAISRAFAHSHAKARRLGAMVSGFSVALTLAYAGLMLVAGPRILTVLFGDDFEPFTGLVVPMSMGQVALGAGLGFGMVLQAEQRGRAVLLAGTVFVLTSLGASIYLATEAGLDGAVWGLSGAAVVTSLVVALLAIRAPRAGMR
jgi:O-antigen/teichoic acid export membrane protein